MINDGAISSKGLLFIRLCKICISHFYSYIADVLLSAPKESERVEDYLKNIIAKMTPTIELILCFSWREGGREGYIYSAST